MLPRSVTTIIKQLNPRVEEYLNKMTEYVPLKVYQVHEGSTYEPLVHKTEAWSCIGVFYDYLIRKEIYNLLGEEAIDNRASRCEELLNDIKSVRAPDDAGECEDEDDATTLADFTFIVNVKQLEKSISSYHKYKDPKNATLDIIEDIFNTSMLHKLYFRETMRPFDPKLLNMNNIKSVLKHVSTFNRNNVALNPDVDCKYFCGDADLILDDVLIEIKVSMHTLKLKKVKGRQTLYQLMLYALGVFINDGKEIRKFKIYNPLMGIEYSLEFPELNFTEFEKLVEEVMPL